jgi:hypothetical protein
LLEKISVVSATAYAWWDRATERSHFRPARSVSLWSLVASHAASPGLVTVENSGLSKKEMRVQKFSGSSGVGPIFPPRHFANITKRAMCRSQKG